MADVDYSEIFDPDEQMSIYRIARNFQDKPKEVVKRLTALVGKDRLQQAVDYLKTLVD
jgi:hypothetical protein